MGTNSGYLDPLISPTSKDDGDPKIRRANINLIGFTVEEDVVNNALKITSGGGGGVTLALADHNAFRALASIPTDGTVIHFQSPPGTYIYDSTSGAGFADDDNIVLKLSSISVGSAGRSYNASTAVMPTYAAYRLIGGLGLFTSYQVQSRSVKNDGGGGIFDYDVTDTTSTDNDGTILVAGSKRAKRRYSGEVHAEWFGVRATGRVFEDGHLTAGSNVLSHASFTQADVGRSILIRTPVEPATGTVTTISGYVILDGAGTSFETEIPNVSSVPLNGGAIYVNGEFLAIIGVQSDTALHVRTAPTHSASGLTVYRNSQIATTIVSVVTGVSATLAISGAAILVSSTTVETTVGDDVTDEVHAANNFAFSVSAPALIYPAGRVCMSDNLYYEGKNSLTIAGQGLDTTILTDMRKASDETLLVDRLVDNYGLLSFKDCDNVMIRDLSVDASVPVIGMAHSTGGVVNNSGGRIGIFFRDCDDCTLWRLGSGGRAGARDELYYCDSIPGTGTVNFRVSDLNVALSNNNSFNAGNVGQGLIVEHCQITSAYSCLQIAARGAIITGNTLTGGGGFTEGNGAEPVILEVIANANILFANNAIVATDSHGFGNPLLTIYGVLSDPTCVVTFHGNQYVNNTGYFYNADSAIIRIQAMQGTTHLYGESFDRNTAGATGGAFINVDGASTGKVTIGPCNFRGRAGSNMTVGVRIKSDVPAGAVTVLPGSAYGESITTPLELGAALAANIGMGTL